ncbi:NAD(P)-binding protein [Imleria badia]|nr:NAD(P)-binding protein [Imleria badia]
MASSEAPSAWTSEALGEWLLEHARAIMGDDPIHASADLFNQGFDSVKAADLRNRLLDALRNSTNPDIKKAVMHIPRNVIYENPTIPRLSARIAAIVYDNGAGHGIDHKEAIKAMIEKYSVGLSGPDDGVLPSTPLIEPAVVLLTGSTGGLGSLLLLELLKCHLVQRVFALNRPSSSKSIEERQNAAFIAGKLDHEVGFLKSAKLVYIEADASHPLWGLSQDRYNEIRHTVTLIIHNAWRVDFNLTISSFEDSIRATRNLIDLGLASPQKEKLRFLFTSSIASSQGWDDSEGHFPEEVQLDPSVAVGAGYGESKYVAERIIAKSGLHATSFRIGQIAGGHGGSWAPTDWFPIIVKSSIALELFPHAAGVVSWLRGEDVALVILDTAFSSAAPPPALNIVNPRSATWTDIVADIQMGIYYYHHQERPILDVAEFGRWFEQLESKAEGASEDDLAKIPAIKLLEFFRSMAYEDGEIRKLDADDDGVISAEATLMTTFCTAKAQKVSRTMKRMEPIGRAEAKAWVSYWCSKGVIS